VTVTVARSQEEVLRAAKAAETPEPTEPASAPDGAAELPA